MVCGEFERSLVGVVQIDLIHELFMCVLVIYIDGVVVIVIGIKLVRVDLDDTGGKGSLTQGVHCEFMVGSETICPHFTQ